MRRLSLEGLGMIRVRYAGTEFNGIVKAVEQLQVSEVVGSEAAVVEWILDSIRRIKAITAFGDIDLTDDRVWAWATREPAAIVLNPAPGARKAIRSLALQWVPPKPLYVAARRTFGSTPKKVRSSAK